jgi:hypothetical protein
MSLLSHKISYKPPSPSSSLHSLRESTPALHASFSPWPGCFRLGPVESETETQNLSRSSDGIHPIGSIKDTCPCLIPPPACSYCPPASVFRDGASRPRRIHAQRPPPAPHIRRMSSRHATASPDVLPCRSSCYLSSPFQA